MKIKMYFIWGALFILTSWQPLSAQNNALTFDGTDDYVSFTTSPSYLTTFTIEAWIKTTSTADANDIVCWGNTSTSSADNVQFRTSHGKLSFGSDPDGDAPWMSCISSAFVNTGTWTHVAVVKDDESVQLYVNGIADGSGTNSYLMNVNYMLIGKYVNDPFYFSGSMDEVRIWNTARTATQIRQNMYQELSDPSSETNLVAYYKCDETSGTTLTDSKGSYNGTLNNYGSQTGYWQTSPAMFGPKNALDFDGTDDYVGFDNSPLYSETISIEAWIKTTNDAEVNDIVCWGNLNQYDNVQFRTSSGKLSFGTQPYDGDWVSCKSSTDVNTGKWTHVAVVKNGESVQLYVNGVADGSGTNLNSMSINYMFIGKYVHEPSYFFSGTMDEVRIWNTARSATQIREDMCKTLTGNESGLVAYYNFDNTSGTTLQDLSGNGYDGTLRDMDETTDWVASSAFNTWLNTSGSDWLTATNWSYGSVPTLSDNVGIYGWSGGNEASISGFVNNMVISSTSSPSLSSGMTVNGSLILEKNMDLNGQTVTLGSSATLVEDAGAFSGISGAITTTRSLDSLSSEDVAGLGAVITTSSNMGSTTITRSHAAVSGNNLSTSIHRQYVITPTTNTGLDATLEFNYLDNELNGLTEANLQLVKSEDSGTTWTEEGGTISTANNTVTLSGINGFSTWTLAESVTQSTANNALDFDGTDDYVDFTTNSPPYSATISIEAWIKTTSNSGETEIVCWRNTSESDKSNVQFRTSSGNFQFGTNNADESNWIAVTSSQTVNTGEWTHVAVVKDGSNVQLYINGIADGSATNNNSLSVDYMLIGKYVDNFFYFDGSIDEVRIWNTARTAAQIRENMTRTLDGNENGLVAYYRFNENSGATAYDATGNGYNGVLTNMDGSDWVDSEAFTTWLGGSSNWSTASNWTDGVPTSTDNVGIYNWGGSLPAIPTGQTINNLVVGSSATVQLDADKTLDINSNLLNEGTFTIKSASANTGSLIVGGTSNGEINVERYMTGNKWHMVSSPVPGQTIVSFLTNGKNAGVATDGDSRGMMDYKESTNTWNSFFTNSSSGAIDADIGYALRTDADGVITFTGSLSTGDQNLTLAKTEDYGWNLIGNPYPSALKANSTADVTNNLLTVNSSSLDSSYVALYIWDEQEGYDGTRSDYAIINHSGGGISGRTSLTQNYIQSGQGFFVKAASSGAGFNITKAMQSHQPTVAFKSAQSEWATLALEATMDETITSTGIKFRDDMTTGLDVGYDAGVFKTGFNIYTKLVEDNGVDFGLQCLPETGIEEYEIPVGLDAATGGEIIFNIKSENLPSGIVPILNDKQAGTSFTFNNEEDVYTATIGETKGYGRFTLTFSSTTDVDDILSSQTRFKAWYSEGTITISGEITGEGEITVYDVQGRKLAVKKPGYSNLNRIEVPQATSGIYLIKVKDSNSSEVLKIVQTGN